MFGTPSGVKDLPAGRETTARFDVTKGDQALNVGVDWQTPDRPPLKAVIVETGGKTIRAY